MRIRLHIFFKCFLLVFFACQNETVEKRKVIALQPFNKIKVIDAFDVYLIEGNEYSAEIVGDEDVIDKINFSTIDSLLTIENDRKVKWRTPTQNKIKINITSLPLKDITAEGGTFVGTITPITSNEFGLILTGKSNEALLELNANIFYYWNNFPTGGKVTLSGQVNELKLWNTALVAVDAKNLSTNYALVENESKGACIINVSERLDYSIRGEGDIEVYGKPTEINLNEKSSKGELIQY